MYKNTSRNNQGRADRIVMKDMPSGPEVMTDDQRRELLKEKMKTIEVKILALPEGNPERKRLGRHKQQLQAALSALRETPKRANLGHYFMEVAQRILPREVYAHVMDEARHVYDIRTKVEAERKATQQRLLTEMIERAEG